MRIFVISYQPIRQYLCPTSLFFYHILKLFLHLYNLLQYIIHMNFMQTFTNALHQAEKTYNSFNNMTNIDKLHAQLYDCTYADDTKFVIQKAVKQLLQLYPFFQTQILTFVQNGFEKKYLEIKGVLEIDVKGKNCKVDYNMMLPNNFPKKSPYVRIINRKDFMVDPFYRNLKSPTDPKSYILNEKLQSIKSWNQYTPLSNIVMECKNIMRTNFPFYKNNTNFQNNVAASGWSSLNQNQTSSNNSWQGQNYNYTPPANQGWNNGGLNNQGWNNQGMNQNFNQYGNNNGGFGFINPQPPIPFNNTNTVNVGKVIENGTKLVSQQKKILQKLKSEHLKAVEKMQSLEIMNNSLDSESVYLRNENVKMSQFLKSSDKSDSSNLSELIKPRDPRSEKILQLTSSIKARDDCISLVQEKFNDDQISFDQFIKLIKRIEEDKFEEKVLLVKYSQC